MKKLKIEKYSSKRKISSTLAAILATAVMGTGCLAGVHMGTRQAVNASETVPQPIKVIDFNEGLNELVMNEEYFEIIKTDKLFVHKAPQEIDTGELVDANGIVYFGKREGIYYYKRHVSNEPTTNHTREKGTFLQMGKNRVVPPVYKTKSAGLEDEVETAILDAAVPYEVSGVAGVKIQDEYVANSEMAVGNPFAGEDMKKSIEEHEGLAFSYWIKAPECSGELCREKHSSDDQSVCNTSAVLRWEVANEKKDDEGEVVSREAVGELQIDMDRSIYWNAKGAVSDTACYANASGVAVDTNWHQVTVNMKKDSVEFYVDGIGTKMQESYGNYVGWDSYDEESESLIQWMTREDATLHFGGAGDFAGVYGLADTSCDFAIDDLKFYGQNLTEEQIRKTYEKDVAYMNRTRDVVGTSIAVESATETSVGVENAIHNAIVDISGQSVFSIKVDENKNSFAYVGACLENPFAGKDLEGATIGYWVKQDDTRKTSVISFVDDYKDVHHPKGESAEGKSILYVENTGLTIFAEGYFDTALCNSLQNVFYAAPDTFGQKRVLERSTEWMYITLSIDNMGVRYYINGEPIGEDVIVEPTSRYLDGYYMTLKDGAEIRNRYGLFGKTGNQGATALMKFLTDEDTGLYLGYYPMKGGEICNKTSGCMFAGLKSVDEALSDEEVKRFYENRFEGLYIPENMPFDVIEEEVTESQIPQNPIESGVPMASEEPEGIPSPEVSGGASTEVPDISQAPVASQKPGNRKPGNVNDDKEVTLADAQIVLRVALLLQDLDKDIRPYADVTGDGEVTLADAQKVLRKALLLDN